MNRITVEPPLSGESPIGSDEARGRARGAGTMERSMSFLIGIAAIGVLVCLGAFALTLVDSDRV